MSASEAATLAPYAALPKPRFTLDDAVAASETWGANCGPGAIAAIAGMTLDELRPHMGDFEAKGYTNPTLMWEVLTRLGLVWRKRPGRVDLDILPAWGVARIQWEGPWCEPGVPVRARYRHTHWIGVGLHEMRPIAFDINCMSVGGWVPWSEWKSQVAPWLIREAVPRANGKWHITHVADVARRDHG